MNKNCWLSLILCTLPTFISIIFQVRFHGVSLILNSVVLPLLALLLTIQNHNIYTDYLTGLITEKLDSYLKKELICAIKKRVFLLFLIDINNFKEINDNYGHKMGMMH